MNVLSLFDGISCGRVALDKIGADVDNYYAYEIDPYAIKVSKKNYPEIKHMGDVCAENFEKYKGIDLLIGGSPCQSLSITTAGKRNSLDGKSKLFFEYVRALREAQPKYFLFENVQSMNEESKNTISEMLGCSPVMIDSADFSAQTRKRYYWTNIPVEKWGGCSLVTKDILQENVEEKYYYNVGYKFLGEDKPVCAILDIKGHDLIKRVGSKEFKCQTLTACTGGNHQKKVYIAGRCRKLTPVEYERLQCLPDGYTEGISDTRRYTACGNGWTVDVIAHLLKGVTHGN